MGGQQHKLISRVMCVVTSGVSVMNLTIFVPLALHGPAKLQIVAESIYEEVMSRLRLHQVEGLQYQHRFWN